MVHSDVGVVVQNHIQECAGVVTYTGRQRSGTVIVDTGARQLYLLVDGGNAIRWGCAVGRDGFRWAG